MPDNPASVLLSAAKDVKALYVFIMEGDVIEIIIDAELGAAKTAFFKIKHANSPDQQLWSAINHLEAAHERLRRTYHGKTAALIEGGAYLERMANKDRFTLCLMASCYKILGEETLCRRALDEAKQIDEERPLSTYSNVMQVPLTLLDPRTYRELYLWLSGQRYNVDVGAFREALLG